MEQLFGLAGAAADAGRAARRHDIQRRTDTGLFLLDDIYFSFAFIEMMHCVLATRCRGRQSGPLVRPPNGRLAAKHAGQPLACCTN